MNLYEEENARLSLELSASGFTLLTNRVNRHSIHYESDIKNAFGVESETKVLLSGSMGDGLGLFYGYERVDKSSDMDLVAILNYNVVEDGEDASNAMMIKETDRQSPGYIRLKVIEHNFLRGYCKIENGKMYLSSALWMERLDNSQWREKYSSKVHGPALDIALSHDVIADIVQKSGCVSFVRVSDPAYSKEDSTGVHSTDLVVCLECKTWPTEAYEWRNRERESGWPGKETVDAVVQTGCILAPIGNKESRDNEFQWRICSNRGEALLTASFKETQFLCYFLLKVINNEILKQASRKNLTSYIMKNTVFWISEKIPPDEWHPRLLINCLVRASMQLRKWVQERFLPNYFIVNRNMFVLSDFSTEIATGTIRAIDNILEDPISAIRQLELIKKAKAEFDWENGKSEIDILHRDICCWLECRREMAINFYFIGNQSLYQAHHFKNIEDSIRNCKTVLRTLESCGGYHKPSCDLVKNSLGVLYYAHAQKHDTDANWKKTAQEYFRESEAVDYTHAPLRMATCLLLDGQYEKVLDLVNKSLDAVSTLKDAKNISEETRDQYFTCTSEMLKTIAIQNLNGLKSPDKVSDLKQLHSIIQRDIENQDLEQTEIALKDKFTYFHLAHTFLWKHFSFDVVFTSAEIEVLPKPVRLEADMKETEVDVKPIPGSKFKRLSFEGTYVLTINPEIYAWYLKFLANFEKAKSLPSNDLSGKCMLLDECGKCLSELNTTLGMTDISAEHRVIGYNLLTYCYMQVGYYKLAARSLIQSLKLDNIDMNVAYYHFEVIIKALLKIDCFKPKSNEEITYKRTDTESTEAVLGRLLFKCGQYGWTAEDMERFDALLYTYINEQVEAVPEEDTELNLKLPDMTSLIITKPEESDTLETFRSGQKQSECERKVEKLYTLPEFGRHRAESEDIERREVDSFEESLENRQDDEEFEILLYQRTSGSHSVE